MNNYPMREQVDEFSSEVRETLTTVEEYTRRGYSHNQDIRYQYACYGCFDTWIDWVFHEPHDGKVFLFHNGYKWRVKPSPEPEIVSNMIARKARFKQTYDAMEKWSRDGLDQGDLQFCAWNKDMWRDWSVEEKIEIFDPRFCWRVRPTKKIDLLNAAAMERLVNSKLYRRRDSCPAMVTSYRHGDSVAGNVQRPEIYVDHHWITAYGLKQQYKWSKDGDPVGKVESNG